MRCVRMELNSIETAMCTHAHHCPVSKGRVAMFARKAVLWALTFGTVLLTAERVAAQPIGYRVGRAIDFISNRVTPDVVVYGGDYPWVYVPGYGYYPMYPYEARPPVMAGPVAGNVYRSYYPPERPLPQPATMTVRVPAEAEVWLQGMKASQTGSERVFVSPPLRPGPEYAYEIRARWRQADGREADWTRRVRVRAGEQLKIDFLASPSDQASPTSSEATKAAPSATPENVARPKERPAPPK
jgi:uncharacterized protein (TIGR03000 family)